MQAFVLSSIPPTKYELPINVSNASFFNHTIFHPSAATITATARNRQYRQRTPAGAATITTPIPFSARASRPESSTVAKCNSGILIFICTRCIPPIREPLSVRSSAPFAHGFALVPHVTSLHFHLACFLYPPKVHYDFTSIAESCSPPCSVP
ncbi:hypothetical protein V6N13_000824 [Hibiscus sabdariffa]|uniref:Uncharacterized protein n=1 Tax=Hibiscus sabdariffa TaxID=183260 RepID=A0ABR2G707_9ROSI